MQPRTGYVVVVGAGIAGLSAAHAILADDHGAGADAPRVTVLEAADRVGGVLHGVEVGSQVVDIGVSSGGAGLIGCGEVRKRPRAWPRTRTPNLRNL